MTINTLCIWGQSQNYSQADTLPTTFQPWWEYWLWNGKVYVRNVDTTLNWSNVGVREDCDIGILWIGPSSNLWERAVEQISFLYQVSFIERIWEIKVINHGNTDTMWVKGLKDWRRHSNSHKWGPDVFDIYKTLSLFHPYSPLSYCGLFSWDQWDITEEVVSFPLFLLFLSRNTRQGGNNQGTLIIARAVLTWSKLAELHRRALTYSRWDLSISVAAYTQWYRKSLYRLCRVAQ